MLSTFFIGILVCFLFYNNLHKVIVINDNLEYDNTLFLPVNESIYCDQIGKAFGKTDSDNLQIFSIVGQDNSKFLCLIKNGKEYIYQSQKQVPLTFPLFKSNKLNIQSYMNDDKANNIIINDKNVLKNIQDDMSDKNIIDMPSEVSMVKQLIFSSAYYPGINIMLQYEHDTQGNCYITNTTTNTTWKIGDELMKYVM